MDEIVHGSVSLPRTTKKTFGENVLFAPTKYVATNDDMTFVGEPVL